VNEINGIWIQICDYFANDWANYLICFGEHLAISCSSLAVAALIGIPFGYICVMNKKWEKGVVGIFQILRVIPSLAVLILLIPLMGTGVKPAMTALVLLAIPPILMNTAAGFSEVPAFMLETAQGLGMTGRQMFWKVKVPQAIPMILAGVKTAMMEIIASAAIAAKIGAGGLGGIILTGLGLNRTDLLLIGGISVAVLAGSVGIIFNRLDRHIFKYKYIEKRRGKRR